MIGFSYVWREVGRSAGRLISRAVGQKVGRQVCRLAGMFKGKLGVSEVRRYADLQAGRQVGQPG